MAITHKNNGFVAEIAKTRLMKFVWAFLPSPKGCQLLPPWNVLHQGAPTQAITWNFISNLNKSAYVHMNGYQPTNWPSCTTWFKIWDMHARNNFDFCFSFQFHSIQFQWLVVVLDLIVLQKYSNLSFYRRIPVAEQLILSDLFKNGLTFKFSQNL